MQAVCLSHLNFTVKQALSIGEENDKESINGGKDKHNSGLLRI